MKIIFLGIFIVMLLASCVKNTPEQVDTSNLELEQDKIPEASYSSFFKQCLDYGCLGFLTPDCPGKTRRLSQDGHEYVPRNVVCELPELPADFDRLKFLFETGKAGFITDLPREYWVQPEFIRNWGESNLLSYQNPDLNYLVRFGIVVYPSELVYEIDTEEIGHAAEEWTSFDFPTSIRSMQTKFFIGLKFTPVIKEGTFLISENSFSDNSKESTNPSGLSKYMKASFDPKQVVLAQSFPVFRTAEKNYIGNYSYAEITTMHINISNQIPKGKYMVAMVLDNPDSNFAYQHQVKNKLYNNYRDGGDDSAGLEYFKVFLWIK